MSANELKRPVVFAIIVLLTSLHQGSAQHMNAKDAPCQQVGPASEETRCFFEKAQSVDRELNLMYNKIRPVLSPDEQRQL